MFLSFPTSFCPPDCDMSIVLRPWPQPMQNVLKDAAFRSNTWKMEIYRESQDVFTDLVKLNRTLKVISDIYAVKRMCAVTENIKSDFYV